MFKNSSLVIVFGQNILFIMHRHLFTNTFILLLMLSVTIQVSKAYNSIGLTLVLKIRSLVLLLMLRAAQIRLSLCRALLIREFHFVNSRTSSIIFPELLQIVEKAFCYAVSTRISFVFLKLTRSPSGFAFSMRASSLSLRSAIYGLKSKCHPRKPDRRVFGATAIECHQERRCYFS